MSAGGRAHWNSPQQSSLSLDSHSPQYASLFEKDTHFARPLPVLVSTVSSHVCRAQRVEEHAGPECNAAAFKLLLICVFKNNKKVLQLQVLCLT